MKTVTTLSHLRGRTPSFIRVSWLCTHHGISVPVIPHRLNSVQGRMRWRDRQHLRGHPVHQINDLAKYPRDLLLPFLALLEAAGVDLVWTPTEEVTYPSGSNRTWVQGADELLRKAECLVPRGDNRRCQAFQRGFTRQSLFRSEDAQQAAVVRRMTRDLDFPARDRCLPNPAEAGTGRPCSSRNSYLSKEERKAANVLYSGLSVQLNWLRTRGNAQIKT